MCIYRCMHVFYMHHLMRLITHMSMCVCIYIYAELLKSSLLNKEENDSFKNSFYPIFKDERNLRNDKPNVINSRMNIKKRMNILWFLGYFLALSAGPVVEYTNCASAES